MRSARTFLRNTLSKVKRARGYRIRFPEAYTSAANFIIR